MSKPRAAITSITGIVVMVAVVSGCGVARSSSSAAGSLASGPDSGIRGQVQVGPTCPVDRGDQNCFRPYAATIVVSTGTDEKVVAQATASATGHFSIALPAGVYVLKPHSGRPYPRAPMQTATVHDHRFTSVKILYYSGIRSRSRS